eukprot:COSAG01_NODE_3454_length_6075_cov_5.552878_11_plen_136_part_01
MRARRSTAERLSGGHAQKNRRLRSMVQPAASRPRNEGARATPPSLVAARDKTTLGAVPGPVDSVRNFLMVVAAVYFDMSKIFHCCVYSSHRVSLFATNFGQAFGRICDQGLCRMLGHHREREGKDRGSNQRPSRMA